MFWRVRKWVSLFKKDVLTLWYACRDPRTPSWVPLLAGGLGVYAFSPLDLIPDIIPIVGLADDAVIVPLGIRLLLKLLPAAVKSASQQQAERQRAKGKTLIGRFGVLCVLLVWGGITVYVVEHYLS
ncbi:YkvA family protein [Pantoea sp. FN060301]|uniref:YkvA family protein n=1 Tax=Pantoea sp. FN060301 TaxID=3420380 RepID=UPI003D16F145